MRFLNVSSRPVQHCPYAEAWFVRSTKPSGHRLGRDRRRRVYRAARLCSPTAEAAENSSRAAQERHACGVVLGLDPSGRQYGVCVMSLDHSLAGLDQARLAALLD
jgi:hypothetical protein